MNIKGLFLTCMLVVGCTANREVVQVYKGDPGTNGTSCSVAPERDEESESTIGARISCTDGSFSIILNGQQGAQGIQGVQGNQGIQGPVGQTGTAGRSCQAYRSHFFDGVYIQCQGQLPVYISDGRDGEDGRDGTSCSVRQTSDGARITCGNSVAFVRNGTDGRDGVNGRDGRDGVNGASCSVSNTSDGARITCGNSSQTLYDGKDGKPGAVGPQGQVGPVGPAGPQGQPGTNALANAIGIKGYIYPCGVEFANDEIFLRLTDGKILAVYDGSTTSNPDLSRLALLAPGNYRTTDRTGTQCNLNVSENLTVSSTPASTGMTAGGSL